MHLIEDYRDWNRALDGEFDAIYIPNLPTLSDDRQAGLLEGMRENRWVVAAGVRDLEEVLDSGRLDQELHEEFDGGLLRLDDVDGYPPTRGSTSHSDSSKIRPRSRPRGSAPGCML